MTRGLPWSTKTSGPSTIPRSSKAVGQAKAGRDLPQLPNTQVTLSQDLLDAAVSLTSASTARHLPYLHAVQQANAQSQSLPSSSLRQNSPMSESPDDTSYLDDVANGSLEDGMKRGVRAEGPGGSDVKRGARIACLECRSAKIRCSAPNDGQVPCKRCSRHDKECVFEKHRRGRKPGRP